MKTIILFLVLLSSMALVNSPALSQDATGKTVMSKGYVVPQSKSALPLEWRGAFISFDATNGFKEKFSRINYGVSSSAVLGYKNYSFRAEAVAPLSAQGWTYRLRFEYQIF